MGCLFCRLAAREVPAQIVFENEHVLAFKDIRPVAPVHCLVIPKAHVPGVADATAEHAEALSQLLLAAREVASAMGIGETGYRLVINQGPDGGQTVSHLHVHVLGGRSMAWPPG